MAESKSDTEVIVIGGGIAGLTTANRAAQLGKKVVVLEKGEEEKYPCNSRWTGGTLHVGFTDPLSDAESLLKTIQRATDGFAHADLAKAMAEDSSRFIKWLRSEGIKMINMGSYHSCILAPPARTGPGLEWEGRGGDVMLRTLESNLIKRGGQLLRGMRAVSLDVSGNSGVHVEVDGPEGRVQFIADSVVIADGGFPASNELLRQYIAPQPEKILKRNAGTSTGDGLRMAVAAGAALTEGLNCFYGHLLSRDALNNNRLWPRPYLDAIVTCGILVNSAGRRFADEGNGGVYMANMVARLQDPLSATLVFDHAIWTGPGANSIIPANPHLTNGGGTLYKADTIKELAIEMGVAVDVLEKEVAEYNAALDAGTLMELRPSRRTDRHKPMPIRTGPFYGIPVCTGVTHIMGGIAINANGEALDVAGKPIRGLYAVGTSTGGLEGGPAIGYLGGLTKSGVTGLRAAEAIAGGGI